MPLSVFPAQAVKDGGLPFVLDCMTMATSTAVIVLPTGGDQQVSASRVLGPGRTLDELYSAAAHLVGEGANRAAHRLGLGPSAVARRIQAYLGDGREREVNLERLRLRESCWTRIRRLDKDCFRLMGYALPYVRLLFHSSV
jgi:hypothetical protein